MRQTVIALSACLALTACSGKDTTDDTGDTVPTDTSTTTTPGTTVATVRLSGFQITDGSFTGGAAVDFYWLDGPHVGSPIPTDIPVDGCESLGGTSSTTPNPPTVAGDEPFGGVVSLAFDGATVSLSNGAGDLGVWPGGQSMDFSASGGEVEDFDLTGVMVVPDPPANATSTYQVDGTIDVTWTGTGPVGGYAYVTVSGVTGSVRCLVQDDGAFTVETADLIGAGYVQSVLVARSLEVEVSEPGVLINVWAYVTGSPP